MKNYIIFILSMTFVFFTFEDTKAQLGYSVDVDPIIISPDGTVTNGLIRFDFNVDLFQHTIHMYTFSSPPFSSNMCLDFNGQLFDPVIEFSVGSLPMVSDCGGLYCFTVVLNENTLEECDSEPCIDVPFCYENRVIDGLTYRLFCRAIEPGFDLPGKDVFITGKGDLTKTNQLASNYSIFTHMPPQEFASIKGTIFDQVEISEVNILEMGTTDNIITSQSEIESDDDIIFKFNSNGELLWVFYNKPTASQFDENGDNLSNSTKTQKYGEELSIEIVSIYPNPFTSNINVELSSDLGQEINMIITDLLGKRVAHKTYNIVKGDNRIMLEMQPNLPSGIYSIVILGEDAFRFSKQIVHAKK